MNDLEPTQPDWVPFLATTSVFGGLPEAALRALAGELDEVTLETGAVLFRQGEPADALYLLREGRLIVFAEESGGTDSRALAMIEPGTCVGEGALIMSGSRSASVRASTPSRLLRLSTANFELLLASHAALRQVLNTLVAARLPGLIDASLRAELKSELTWVRLRRGDVLFHAGEAGDAVYVVARGRLGGYRVDASGREELVAEIGAGEPVGEIALLTKEPRTLTIRALRSSELVRLSAEGFEAALARNPQAIVPVARTLAQRLRAVATTSPARSSIRAIAVLPVSPDVPVEGFIENLEGGLRPAGAVLSLTSIECEALFGAHAAEATSNSTMALRMADWLGSVEGGHDIAIYQCDPWPSPWTRMCVGRADRVLVVGRGRDAPALGGLQPLVEEYDPSTRELVLLHEAGTKLPSGTAAWLRLVKPARHHHVRVDRAGDAHRVARLLSGRAVGMVFGGGGARGYAHAGVVRALLEAGVTIDVAGGVSMGSMPAAVLAQGGGYERLMQAFRHCFVAPNKPFMPYTVPILSVFNVRRTEKAFIEEFGDTQIEDLWLSYFALASDITTGEAKVFREGSLWQAMFASGAFPALFPPRPVDGHLMVDGGLLSNLPIEPMRALCRGTILACDVSKEQGVTVDPALTRPPRVRQALWSLLPFTKPLGWPRLTTVLVRAIESREAGQRAQLRRSAAYCFTPPIEQFNLDQVQALDEISEVGYRYARSVIGELPPGIARQA